MQGIFRIMNGQVVGGDQGCIRREGTSEAAPEAVRQAVGGGCQSSWRRLLSVTNAIQSGTCRQGDSGWAEAGRPGRGGGYLTPFQCIPGGDPLPQNPLPPSPDQSDHCGKKRT